MVIQLERKKTLVFFFKTTRCV